MKDPKKVSKKPLVVWGTLFFTSLILFAAAFALTFIPEIITKLYKVGEAQLPAFAALPFKTLFGDVLNSVKKESMLAAMFNFKAFGKTTAITTYIGLGIIIVTAIVVIAQIIVFIRKHKSGMLLWIIPTLIAGAFLLELDLMIEAYVGTLPGSLGANFKMFGFKQFLTFKAADPKSFIGISVTLYLFLIFTVLTFVSVFGIWFAPIAYANEAGYVTKKVDPELNPVGDFNPDELQPNEFEENVNNLNTIGTTSPLVVQYINSYGEQSNPAPVAPVVAQPVPVQVATPVVQAAPSMPADYVTKSDMKDLLTQVLTELKAKEEETKAEEEETPVVEETPVEPEVKEPEEVEIPEDIFANLIDDDGNQVEVIDAEDLKAFIENAVNAKLEQKAKEEEAKAEIKVEEEKIVNDSKETLAYDEDEDEELPVETEEEKPQSAVNNLVNHTIVVAVPADYKEDEEVVEPEEDETSSMDDVRDIIAEEISAAFKDITLPKKETVVVKKVVKQAPVAVEEPKPVVKEVAPKEATPVKKVEPKPQPKPQPKPIVRNEVRGSEIVVEKGETIRLNFLEKVANGSKDLVRNYNQIKNLLMSFDLKDRLSNSADTFRLHKKTFAKITTNGDALKLFLALNPQDFMSTALPIQDMSQKAAYKEIPLAIKVKSELSLRRATELIYACMRANDLEQLENADMSVDYVKLVRKELKKQENSKR